jgi:hypothetical protein
LNIFEASVSPAVLSVKFCRVEEISASMGETPHMDNPFPIPGEGVTLIPVRLQIASESFQKFILDVTGTGGMILIENKRPAPHGISYGDPHV